jgi:alkylation response protein AidB-like acyl-CoA dehydrogenase
MNMEVRHPVHSVGAQDVVPTPDELRARVQALLPAIRERAHQTEREGKVPEENLTALREAGLYRIVQPRSFGGYEYGFDLLVEFVIDIAGACPSTGWCYGLYGAHQWLVASIGPQAELDVWTDNPDAVVCGSYAPAGKAIAVEGGYRLTGQWLFASGCHGAQWAVCSTILPPKAEGATPAPAFMLVPASDYTIAGEWDVVGLAGTGSKCLVLEDVFVPDHRALPFRDTTSGKTVGSRFHADNPEFSVPMLCNIPSCLAATAVGAAKGAVADYLAATSTRITRGAVAGNNNRMAEFATVQLRVAEAAASVDAAEALLLRDLRARAEAVREGREVTVEDRITSRRGQAFAVSLAIRATEALNASTGGQGLAMSNPVQRAWRDANAVGRHISLNWDAVGTMYGQMVLGLEPKGQY